MNDAQRARPIAVTRPIAVIGMAGRFPGASDVERYWQNLVSGVESITHAAAVDGSPDRDDAGPRFVRSVARVSDIELFDAEYFRIPPAEAALMDPQHRLLLEVAALAMQHAGYHAVRDERVGVFVGCGENYYLRDHVEPHEASGGHASGAFPPSASGTDVRILSANEKDFLAARIAFKLGLTGPSVTVQATCATGLTAVALACSALIAGDCDIALAGGVSLVMPEMDGYTYSAGGIFSADGRCRPFDAAASGTVPGSGAALVVLRPEDDARASRDRRHAVIRGWAINHDGGSRAGFTAPSIAGQQAVIQAALARAGAAPDDVGYVETHGTATPIGDAVEIEALRMVFASRAGDAPPLVLGAVKPNIGHADAAAGVAGLIKAVHVVERGVIPPTLHFRSAGPELALESSPFQVRTEPTRWQSSARRLAGVSAFGLGGNNAHVVIEAPDPLPVAATLRSRQVITLSARTEAELLRMRSNLADWVEDRQSLSAAELADVAFTLACGRPQFEYRWATCIADAAGLLARLRAAARPARPVLRWSLHVHGPVRDHAACGRRRVAHEPMVCAALADLAGVSDLDGRPDLSAAVLSALAALRALNRLGLSFGRVEAPGWARRAVDWLGDGAERGTLEQAIDAGRASDDEGTAREGASRLLIGPDFDLAAAVGQAWSGGAAIDWGQYFAPESRGRVPLPGYPFSRRRYWLDRAPRQPVPAAAEATATATATAADDLAEGGVAGKVAAVYQSVLGLDNLDHDAHFIDELSGDSMYAVEIGARLGEIFHLDVPIDLPFIAPTVASTAKFIEDALASPVSSQRPETA
jgi:acyl transferase domain-containing protein